MTVFLCSGGKKRSRWSGGGRKPLSTKLEELLLEWIENRRACGLRVSCKLIVKKAEVTYRDMTENNLVDNDDFKASKDTTVDATGKKSITLKSTGHEKAGVSVCLAAKADGRKLKPMVVLKGAKQEVAALKQKLQHRAVVASSANGWMDTEVTKIWVDSVLGSFSFNRTLLAWDSYECHMEDSITELLKAKNIDRVIVPRGCTKYIQEPDVSWNKPFKSSCTEKCDEWLGTVGINEETTLEI
ncbi:Pogo transposable element with KRAB domain [Stylophora pistillata]|uniref:Pogo transposable element with KRAB domain n=1 Tax=Stylophora pistillata TaxID=50429 RepID=A0A2B4SS03_STYPI|nr:Pogo transposable element with KRAB domain [Stylophora pistillata]